MLDARIVDQNIGRSQFLGTFSDHCPDFIWLHHISARMECFATTCSGEFRDIALYGIRITKTVDHHIGALGRQCARITQTNARC